MQKEIILFLLLIIILILPIIQAEEFYANTLFEINAMGETKISGITNYPGLEAKTTQELTSKIGSRWKFEINLKEIFSEYVYEIQFPSETEIEKIETNSNYRITTTNGQITVIGTGNQKPLNLIIYYTLEKKGNNFNLIILILLIIILITSAYFLLKKEQNKNKKQNKTIYDKDALTERQLKIMELVEKSNGKITQSEIQKILNYPKAALSRNLQTLEKKGIITKERKGMTMLVKINEKIDQV